MNTESWESIACWMTAVSSVTPSPLAPRARTLATPASLCQGMAPGTCRLRRAPGGAAEPLSTVTRSSWPVTPSTMLWLVWVAQLEPLQVVTEGGSVCEYSETRSQAASPLAAIAALEPLLTRGAEPLK